MSVTIYHKGVSPISAATIWAIDGDYLPVEWTVLLVSLLLFRSTMKTTTAATTAASKPSRAALDCISKDLLGSPHGLVAV